MSSANINTFKIVDELFDNSDSRMLLNQRETYCFKLKRFFYTRKPCMYKTLFVFLSVVLLESYSFIFGGIGYIIYLSVQNSTDTSGYLFTDNCLFNNLLLANIISGLTSTVFVIGLYCYNK